MWGGRRKPTPEREPIDPALFPPAKPAHDFKVRPGAIVPGGPTGGFIPPWLRRERPQYADPGPVFRDDD